MLCFDIPMHVRYAMVYIVKNMLELTVLCKLKKNDLSVACLASDTVYSK